jgi:hypothetical protein
MYQIAYAAAILHTLNLIFYTIVLDYQISPYLMGGSTVRSLGACLWSKEKFNQYSDILVHYAKVVYVHEGN